MQDTGCRSHEIRFCEKNSCMLSNGAGEGHPALNERTHLTGQAKNHEETQKT